MSTQKGRGICRRCGHLYGPSGEWEGHMVFGERERGDGLCAPCNRKLTEAQGGITHGEHEPK